MSAWHTTNPNLCKDFNTISLGHVAVLIYLMQGFMWLTFSAVPHSHIELSASWISRLSLHYSVQMSYLMYRDPTSGQLTK